jgi:hypothetical protein
MDATQSLLFLDVAVIICKIDFHFTGANRLSGVWTKTGR